MPGTPGDDTFKSLFQTQNQSDTGANGTNQIAYTWELGNGMTLNVGADERRTKAIANLSNNVTTVGTNPDHSVRPVSASDAVDQLRGQPSLGSVWRIGGLQQGQRNLLQRCGRHPGDLGYR